MAKLKAFSVLRPKEELAGEIAALPYDVMNDQEALKMVQGHPYSFLNIDKPSMYIHEPGEAPYITAGQKLQQMVHEGLFVSETEALYIYEIKGEGFHQLGLVGLVSSKDYQQGIIKKHENTLSEKEQERIWHIMHCKAHTGPIYLFEQESTELDKQLKHAIENKSPLLQVSTSSALTHNIYKIEENTWIRLFIAEIEQISCLYIADGHHRAAAASKVSQLLGSQNPEAQDFLAVIFPKNQLNILAYHRVIKDESDYTKEELFEKLNNCFQICPLDSSFYLPNEPHTFGMRYQKTWYQLKYDPNRLEALNEVQRLDVSILHDEIISPCFGITHPKEDPRIDFVSSSMGIEELNRRTDTDMDIAFSLYPTSIDELIAVADQNGLMPPKSTWFDPKLLSGLLIHPFA